MLLPQQEPIDVFPKSVRSVETSSPEFQETIAKLVGQKVSEDHFDEPSEGFTLLSTFLRSDGLEDRFAFETNALLSAGIDFRVQKITGGGVEILVKNEDFIAASGAVTKHTRKGVDITLSGDTPRG